MSVFEPAVVLFSAKPGMRDLQKAVAPFVLLTLPAPFSTQLVVWQVYIMSASSGTSAACIAGRCGSCNLCVDNAEAFCFDFFVDRTRHLRLLGATLVRPCVCRSMHLLFVECHSRLSPGTRTSSALLVARLHTVSQHQSRAPLAWMQCYTQERSHQLVHSGRTSASTLLQLCDDESPAASTCFTVCSIPSQDAYDARHLQKFHR